MIQPSSNGTNSDSTTNQIHQLMIQKLMWSDSETNVVGFRNKSGRIQELMALDSATFQIQKLMQSDSETYYSETNVFGFRNSRFPDSETISFGHLFPNAAA